MSKSVASSEKMGKEVKGKWSAVFAGGRQSRTSAWPEYLKKRIKSGEVAREEEEKEL